MQPSPKPYVNGKPLNVELLNDKGKTPAPPPPALGIGTNLSSGSALSAPRACEDAKKAPAQMVGRGRHRMTASAGLGRCRTLGVNMHLKIRQSQILVDLGCRADRAFTP